MVLYLIRNGHFSPAILIDNGVAGQNMDLGSWICHFELAQESFLKANNET